MKCLFCSNPDTSVVDSRVTDDGDSIRRRRSCAKCEQRFTTYERAGELTLKVIKKNGQVEEFNREKIKKGLVKATWKRPISMSQIELLINDIERTLLRKGAKEVKSWEVGNLLINRLKKIDKLSYLLFASVYRDFDSLSDFQEEITKLEKTS